MLWKCIESHWKIIYLFLATKIHLFAYHTNCQPLFVPLTNRKRSNNHVQPARWFIQRLSFEFSWHWSRAWLQWIYICGVTAGSGYLRRLPDATPFICSCLIEQQKLPPEDISVPILCYFYRNSTRAWFRHAAKIDNHEIMKLSLLQIPLKQSWSIPLPPNLFEKPKWNCLHGNSLRCAYSILWL